MGQTPSEEEHPSQTSSEGDVHDSPYDEQPENQNSESIDPQPREEEDDEAGDGLVTRTGPYSSSSPPITLTNMVKPIVQDEPPTMPLPTPKPIETVPTEFKWSHGGDEVFVTGSFNDWQGKIRMTPNEIGEFMLVLNIPAGTHQYKFIVDEEWRLNPDSPTVEEQGVTNNIIEVKRAVFEDTSVPFLDSDDEEEFDDEGRKLFYGQRMRTTDGKVPKMPPHLKHPMLDAPPPPPPGDRYELPTPEYVTLNHLYVYNTDMSDQDVLVSAITQRFKTKPFASLKSKFVTTIYYAPKPAPPFPLSEITPLT